MLARASARAAQRGFTLMEMAVTVVAIGILGVIMTGYVDTGQALFYGNQLVKQERINDQIADAMLEWSLSNNNLLPVPYADAPSNRLYAPLSDTPAAGAETMLLNMITSRGVNLVEINDDARGLQNVRVYQRLANNTVTQPFFGLSGPDVTLTYDIGVIYHTQCSLFDPCNTGAGAADPPGFSPQLTAANRDTWTTAGTDTRPSRINTLSIQQALLRQTGDRINVIRNQLRAFFNSLQVASPPGSPDNFFPFADTNGDDAPDRAGNDPASANQDCYDGWYDLTDAGEGTAILRELGLSPEEYSRTAFGAPLEFCRDYDPANNTGTEGILPHNAAIRMHRSVSEGLPPSAVVANNIVFSL